MPAVMQELEWKSSDGCHVCRPALNYYLLCKVATEDEAMEHCAAFIQLYREQAHYLERTAPWIERVGLDSVKRQMFDDPEAVRRLAARFRYSQTFMQDDPWAKRAEGERADLHQHLATVRPAPEFV